MDYNKFGFKNKTVDKFNSMYNRSVNGPGDPPKKTDNGGSVSENKNYKYQMAERRRWSTPSKRSAGLTEYVTDPKALSDYMKGQVAADPKLEGMELKGLYTDKSGTQSYPDYKEPSKTITIKPNIKKPSSTSTKGESKPAKKVKYVDPDVEFAYRTQTVYDPETRSSRVKTVPYAKKQKGKGWEMMDTPRVVYPSDEPGFVQGTPLVKKKKKK